MIIKSHMGTYETRITGPISLREIAEGKETYVVADRKVFALYRDSFFKGAAESDVVLFDAVESNKNIESALAMCADMAKRSFKRNGTMISVGGGIVQDVTGFAANIYNRGVKWEYVPTTLLAQCDSCIGGKTSLNFLSFKNILGTFYAPEKIYIWLDFVRTLTEDDYLSGMGEVAKFNIMSAADGLPLLEQNLEKILKRDTEALSFFVGRSLEFKKKFIEEDEFDRGVRNLLNFAHTFGHAFESVSGYAVPHGQAVNLGLMVANSVSAGRKMLGEALKERIEKICLNFVSVKLEKQWFDADTITGAMKKDKKRRAGGLAAVLFSEDYSLKIVQDLEPGEVSSSLRAMVDLLERHGKF